MARRGGEADPFLRALRELGESGACGGLGFVSSVRLQPLSSGPAHIHTLHPDAAQPTQTSFRPARRTMEASEDGTRRGKSHF